MRILTKLSPATMKVTELNSAVTRTLCLSIDTFVWIDLVDSVYTALRRGLENHSQMVEAASEEEFR